MADGNRLYYGDNLDVLRRHIPDESIDLVYLDPPFKSNQDYNVLFAEKTGKRSAAQILAFEDTWRWDDGAERVYVEMVEAGGKVSQAMQAFRTFLGESDMMAYLAMMAPRLVELRRVLKPTGSIYLHCDSTASHYLKLLMDAVFGVRAYRNEIVWRRTPFAGSSKARALQYPRSHDTLLFYTVGDSWTWNGPTKPYGPEYLGRFKWDDHDGRGPYRKTLLKTYSEATFDRLKKENRLVEPVRKGAMYSYKQFLSESSGQVQIDDIWIDINAINPVAQERLGYPTQKPEALLERIINASSNPSDLVLDPFCGCGTTISVAQRLNRQWIGIDITHLAIGLMRHRLKTAFGDALTFEVVGEPKDLAGAHELALQDRYQFQIWALGLVGARSVEQKKGADKGIDGQIYFHDEGASGKTKQIILSVKSGKTGSAHVRDLLGVLQREGAEIGVLITLQEPTRDMTTEAVKAGFYESPWGKHPRCQILTIAELLDNRGIDAPPIGRWAADATLKAAPKAKRTQPEAATLFDSPVPESKPKRRKS